MDTAQLREQLTRQLVGDASHLAALNGSAPAIVVAQLAQAAIAQLAHSDGYGASLDNEG